VAAWVKHQEGLAPRPFILDAKRAEREDLADLEDEPEEAAFDVDVDFKLFVDTLAESAKAAWDRLGDVTASATDALDTVRWREPRLRRLVTLDAASRISAALILTQQARRSPDATFFLWQGRAFTYRDADVRVTNVVKGLHVRGVRPGDRVAVVMGSRPSFLSMVTALSRLGAIAVLVPPDTVGPKLREALATADAKIVACDPDLAERCREATSLDVLVLGGGGSARALPLGLVDMEAIDVSKIELPPSLPLDAGIGGDVALVLLRPADGGGFRAAEVTNHRWALSALGAAAACTLKPEDTVYCAIPLHHPAGVLVSVGSALVGGTRLALGRPFSPETFFSEVRRYGATVVFYAGEMLRALVNQPPHHQDKSLPVRLFAGSGMRPDLWRRITERFGAGVMEFYASTTEPVIIANASGEKVGALGRPLPGSAQIDVVRADRATGAVVRDDRGRAIRCLPGEPGLLVARLDGDLEAAEVHRRVERGLFADHDKWFVSSDVVRRDADGDYWLVDAAHGLVARGDELASTRSIEDALYALPEVQLAAAFPGELDDGARVLAACVTARETLDADRLTRALAELPDPQRPDLVLQVDAIPLTEGFRPRKRLLQAAGLDKERASARWRRVGERYEPG
jgi:putative long chain acyl-CoA synthase